MLLATWNVNSIRARLPKVLGWVQKRRPDVLCLQEIKCLDEQFPRAEFEAEGYAVETFGQKTYNGVAILAREPLADVARGFTGGDEGGARVLAATVGGLRVVNAYVVNGKEVGHEKYALKLRWMEALAAHVALELQRHPRLALLATSTSRSTTSTSTIRPSGTSRSCAARPSGRRWRASRPRASWTATGSS